MTEEFCDPETGECVPSNIDLVSPEIHLEDGKEIIYVGDPMCSWCWGISNHLKELKDHFPQYKFTIVVGGLRPGGGDPWDDKMKDFLSHHWEEVTKRSGQPFGNKLFEQEEFNYDTEPPCRAVVASRNHISPDSELAFFEAISRKFYVENEDPSDAEFYRSICEGFSISFEHFIKDFKSEEMKAKTNAEFQMNRQWGVTGYPTVLFVSDETYYQVNHGYSEFNEMKNVIEKIVNN